MKVLITGGATGIGLGLKQALEAEGHKVKSWSRRNGVDITSPNQVKWAAAALQYPLDLVVHNAGLYHYEVNSLNRADRMERLFAVNVAGAERVQEWLINYSRLTPNATILAMSTVDVEAPQKWQAGYQCSKVALEILMKSWEIEYPEYRYLIYRAHLTATGMWDPTRGPAIKTLDETVEEICQLILS